MPSVEVVAFFLTLLIQCGTGVWWARGISSDLKHLTENFRTEGLESRSVAKGQNVDVDNLEKRIRSLELNFAALSNELDKSERL
jgi:TolA-binding protein